MYPVPGTVFNCIELFTVNQYPCQYPDYVPKPDFRFLSHSCSLLLGDYLCYSVVPTPVNAGGSGSHTYWIAIVVFIIVLVGMGYYGYQFKKRMAATETPGAGS